MVTKTFGGTESDTSTSSSGGEKKEKGKSRLKLRLSASYSDKVDDLQDILTGIPDRPAKGLMTFEELQDKIGKKPKKDRLGGMRKMSGRYKAIGIELEGYKRQLAATTLADLADGGRIVTEQVLNGQLDRIEAAARRYQKKHTGTKGRGVQGLIDDVERLRKELGPTLDLLEKDGEGGMPEGLALDQAMAAGRAGIKPGQLKGVSPKRCNFAKFNDENLSAPTVELGKGAVNTVQLVNHGGVGRVFKKEQQVDTSKAWAPNMMGIDTQNDPRYGNRNVAGGVLGKVLGTKVMPQCEFGVSNGEVGLVMEKAPGDTVQKMLKEKRLKPDSFTPKALASLQEQLADLEVCDILTGQADRHSGNYMIEVEGDKVTVTAIDNDFSFPDASKAMGEKGRVPLNFLSMNSIKELPALMSKSMADKVLAIDFDRDLAPEFGDLLKKPEIDSARDRLDKLQEHVRGLQRDGYIVTNWQTWRSKPPSSETAAQFLAGLENDSLFGRDFGGALDLR